MTQHSSDHPAERYALIPEWVLVHRGLTPGAIHLYMVLALYADRDGRVIIGVSRLAELTGRTPRMVQKNLRQLEGVGAIKVEPREARPNLYLVQR